eukprot:2774605-Heterocapsa_arctica.AAC.1
MASPMDAPRGLLRKIRNKQVVPGRAKSGRGPGGERQEADRHVNRGRRRQRGASELGEAPAGLPPTGVAPTGHDWWRCVGGRP